jgi:DNA-binding CsgD family transcriptional regulator
LQWPLVGRTEELGKIAEVRTGGALPGVVIHGPAGVGKSRLAREAAAAAEREGALVEWVQATRSAATVPLGAFAGLLDGGVRSDDLLELMRSSVDTLRERAGRRPLVLGVDDAQSLDPTSAALVLHLATTGTAFVLATVRAGEPVPDAIVALWKDQGAARLELEHLGEEETGAVVEAALGGPLEQAAHQWIFQSSRGNVLYTREIVLGARDRGALRLVDDLWRLDREQSLSSSLVELVSDRMAELTDDERRVIELLALGEPLPLSELTGLASTEAVAATEARGMIAFAAPAAGQAARLSHPLYGEVLRASLPAARGRDVRLRLAAMAQTRPDLTPADALRIAYWLHDAGEPIPPALLLDAARAAIPSGDPELGARLAARAVEAGAGVEASLVLARAYAARKRFAEAEAVLAGIEDGLPTQEIATDYLEQRIAVLYWGLRQLDAAQALLVRAAGWWPEPAWQLHVEPLRLHLDALTAWVTGQADVSEQLLADPKLAPEIRQQLEPIHAVNLFFGGRAKEAYALIRRIRPAVPLRSPSDSLALIAWSMIGVESGEDFPEVQATMERTLTQAVRANDHGAAGLAALSLGGQHYLAGRLVDAARWLAEAELQFEHGDAFGTVVVVRASAVYLAHTAGDGAGAAEALRRCHDAIAGPEPLANEVPYVVRARAMVALGEGDPAGAQRMLLDTATEMAQWPIYAAQLLYEALRAGAPARDVLAPLRAARERSDARLTAAYVADVEARVAGDGAALLTAVDELEAIGTLVYAREAAAEAARLFLAAGRQDSARRAAARSRDLFARGQGGIAPAIDGLDGPAVALTPRETQLVELAARGLSNAEIADRLVLSVRTVESHVYRAMQKLGVSDRRDLRAPGDGEPDNAQ